MKVLIAILLSTLALSCNRASNLETLYPVPDFYPDRSNGPTGITSRTERQSLGCGFHFHKLRRDVPGDDGEDA
jgi:hypothetical protein